MLAVKDRHVDTLVCVRNICIYVLQITLYNIILTVMIEKYTTSISSLMTILPLINEVPIQDIL